MKNKLLAVMAIFGMVASASAVKVNNNLSINGFLDFSYVKSEGDQPGAKHDDQSLELDEVELDFIVNVGNVSGEVHIDDHGTGDGNTGDGNANRLDVEQAHFTYSLENGVFFTAGKYGSRLGFEREDPAGLYTFSRAYGDIASVTAGGINNGTRADTFNLGNVDAEVNHGITIGYSANTFSLAASLQNDAGGDQDDIEEDNADLEISFTYTGFQDVTIGGGYHFDNEVLNSAEEDVLNIHASKSFGKLLVAAEYTEVQTENTAIGDLDAYMILLDYDFNDKLGAALRISSNETETANEDYDKITIAPNYQITDSLGAILEYSDIDQGTRDVNELAIELTYTF